MDYTEDAETAFNTRKYLLNRLFDQKDLHVPKETLNEDEDLT